jgi:hypothetical protein
MARKRRRGEIVPHVYGLIGFAVAIVLAVIVLLAPLRETASDAPGP